MDSQSLERMTKRQAVPVLGEAQACTPSESFMRAYASACQEPTLDDARALFTKQLELVQDAYRHMTETADPEVFAFRAGRLPAAVNGLERAAYLISTLAAKAATK